MELTLLARKRVMRGVGLFAGKPENQNEGKRKILCF
jgi:hypothetical protein